jgi:hypothetical protein
MPLVRYFFFVGGALLALLFISNAYLPKPPDVVTADADLPVIRIHSDRKWPERVVFDTNRPTIVPMQTANAGAGVPAAAKVADLSAKARLREAFAQLQPPAPAQAQISVPAKPERKLQPKHKVAKRRAAPPVMLVAQQPQFGFFGNNTW